jgi:hypothetical protein
MNDESAGNDGPSQFMLNVMAYVAFIGAYALAIAIGTELTVLNGGFTLALLFIFLLLINL